MTIDPSLDKVDTPRIDRLMVTVWTSAIALCAGFWYSVISIVV